MKKLLLALMMLAPVAANAQKFGHVNTQEIMQAMPELKTVQTELEALSKQYEADLQSMQEEFQKKYEDYQKNGATLPDNIKQRREQELQDMDQKIRQSYQDNQLALQQAQQEKMQPIITKVRDAITAVGQEGGYVFIAEMGTFIYTSTTLSTDVTTQVKAKLGLK